MAFWERVRIANVIFGLDAGPMTGVRLLLDEFKS